MYGVDKTDYLDPRLVLSIHEALCSNVDNISQYHERDNELKLGDMLDKDSLYLFLFHCSNFIPSFFVSKDVILEVVKMLMPLCEDRNRLSHGASLQNAGNIEETAPQPTSYPNFRIFLWSLVSHMEAVDKAIERARGHSNHAAMEDLMKMKDLENEVHAALATTLYEQVNPHALQYDIDAWFRAQSDKDMVTSTDKVVETELPN
jgi:hypothetical protein